MRDNQCYRTYAGTLLASRLIGAILGRSPRGTLSVAKNAWVRPLTKYFAHVVASDVHNYAVGELLANELLSLRELADVGVCLLVRATFLEGTEQHATFFEMHLPE